MEDISIYISGGVIISVLGFFIRWFVADMNKKFDLLFEKIESMAKESEVEKLRNKIEVEIDKKERAFIDIQKEIQNIKDKMNRCPSCNKV